MTGAGSGIGRAIATRIAAEGGRVVAGDVVPDGLATLAEELGDDVATLAGDVTMEADVAALVALAVERFGGLDAAFHVAGASRPGLIVDLAEDDWDFTVDLCLKGVFLGIKHAARRMIEQGRGGAIVNVASLNSRVPMFFGAAYSAAKAGVVSLGQTAALELGEHGIRVSTVSPGLTATPLVAPMTGVPASPMRSCSGSRSAGRRRRRTSPPRRRSWRPPTRLHLRRQPVRRRGLGADRVPGPATAARRSPRRRGAGRPAA